MARNLSLVALAIFSLSGCAIIGSHYGSSVVLAYTFQHGVAAYRSEQYDTAVRDFGDVIARSPSYEAAYEWRGVARAGMRDFRDAIADYNQALRLLSETGARGARRSAVLQRRAEAKNRSGDFAGSISDDTQAIGLNPGDPYTYLNRASIYTSHREYAKALADQSQVLRKDPYLIVGLRERATTYAALHDYPHAIADETSIIGGSTTDALAFNDRCWYQALSGTQFQVALRDCNAALRLPISNDLRYATLQSRCVVYFKMGQLKRSLADCNAALTFANGADAYYQRGLVERALGNSKNAQRDFVAALAIDPKIDELYAGYGMRR